MSLAETGLNWDAILKAIPVVVAVFGAVYKLRDSRPRRRATLKADLELLKAARAQKLDCSELEDRLQEDLSHLAMRKTATDRVSVVIGSLLAITFGLWTVYIVRDGFSWWALASGFFTFVGLSIVIAGLAERRPAGAQEAAGRSLEPIEPGARVPAVRR